MPDFDADVIVVGGGISGLTCAWRLQREGVDVLLLEAAPRAGGAISSLRKNGLLLEAGPNSTLDTTPLLGALIEGVGIAAERIAPSAAARNRYILRGGRLIAMPMSPAALVGTRLFSMSAKLRLLREPFIERGPAEGEESVGAFVRRRLGDEFLDYAINPFVAGVYAGDPDQLSVKAAFPRLFALEQKYGGLIRGQILGARERKRNPERSKQAATMLSFRDGMQSLTDAIARHLLRIEVDCEVKRVSPQSAGFLLNAVMQGAGRDLRARAVVIATPAESAAQLIEAFAARAAAALQAIHYPPVAVVLSTYRRDEVAHPLDGFGVLVPQCERRLILGTIFSSTLFEHRAPAGDALLTTFVGGMRHPDLAQRSEEEIAGLAQSEHAALLGAPARANFVRVRRWPKAIPQYSIGHLERMTCIDEAESTHPGLFFCANYRGGISVGDCVKSADRTVGQVMASLAGASGKTPVGA
jgi:oxygen-dependent protoporphyrinogen oxidase